VELPFGDERPHEEKGHFSAAAWPPCWVVGGGRILSDQKQKVKKSTFHRSRIRLELIELLAKIVPGDAKGIQSKNQSVVLSVKKFLKFLV
jgi:hypothetical protein